VTALSRPPATPPALHLQIGDVTDNGTATQDRHAKDWLGRLPGPNRYTILGNHDIWGWGKERSGTTGNEPSGRR
jgi:3',5'-cyclic AMP phosphodiesterase CpdA